MKLNILGPIWVDFQRGDPSFLMLDTLGTMRDLLRQGIHLKEGAAIRIYQEDESIGGRKGYIFSEGIVRRKENTWGVELTKPIGFSEGSENGPPNGLGDLNYLSADELMELRNRLAEFEKLS